jgi:glutathione synthase
MNILDIVEKEGGQQEVALGVLRSDYMLHEPGGAMRGLLQVELNTISSSFGSLGTKVNY